MRRFSIIVVLLAGAFYALVSAGEETAKKDGAVGNEAMSMSAPADGGGTLAKLARPKFADWQERIKPEFKTFEPGKKPPALPTVETSKDLRTVAEKAAVETDSVGYADTHIPSSTNTTEVGPALAKLSLIDLKAAAQQELARLGCYAAKIDGLWGPKSRAAVQEFNKRVEGGWDDSATAQLVKALRGAPDGLCERDCSANAPGESCVVALSDDKDGSSASGNNEDLSYLPPWMRGKKLASTEPDALISQLKQENAQPTEAAPQRARRAKRKTVVRTRVVETSRKRTLPKWVPNGWPGANR